MLMKALLDKMSDTQKIQTIKASIEELQQLNLQESVKLKTKLKQENQ